MTAPLTEITGLITAEQFAIAMMTAHAQAESETPAFLAALRAAGVDGEAVRVATVATELQGNATQAWADAAVALSQQDQVADAYTAVPDAGSKEFLTDQAPADPARPTGPPPLAAPGATCVFCQLIEADSDEILLHRWPDAVAFVPRNPVVEDGHLLVVPRRHVPNAASDPELTGQVMRRAAELAGAWPALNILTSIGAEATQTVFHLHIHLVLRQAGDGLHLPWTGQQRRATEATAGGTR